MGISFDQGTTFTIEGDLLLTLSEGSANTGTTQRIVSSKQVNMASLVVNGNVLAGATSEENAGTLRLGGTKNIA